MTRSRLRRFAEPLAVAAFASLAAALLAAAPAAAGMGAVFPKWHPTPCSGDSCRADDPRSDSDCQGLLCSFSSSKAMQPPMTAARAEELARARAAAEAAQAAAKSIAPDAPAPGKSRKRIAKAKAKAAPKAVAAATPPVASPAVDITAAK